jgi:hypothetical protein
LLEELKELSRKNDEITIEKEQAQDKLSVVEKEVWFTLTSSFHPYKRR